VSGWLMAPLLLATVCGTLLRRVRGKRGGAGGEAGEMERGVGASARETLYLRQEQTSAKVAAVSQEVGRLGSRLRLSRRELKPRVRQVRAASGGNMAERGVGPSLTLFGVCPWCVQARFHAHVLAGCGVLRSVWSVRLPLGLSLPLSSLCGLGWVRACVRACGAADDFPATKNPLVI